MALSLRRASGHVSTIVAFSLFLALPLCSVVHAQESSPALHGDAIERDAARLPAPPEESATAAAEAPGLAAQLPAPGITRAPLMLLPEVGSTRQRGPLLTALYASFLTLQVADIHSTFRALDRGAHEANPIMAPFAEHRPLLVALKLGTAAGTIYMTDRLRRHNRLAAILTMVAIDSAYLTVVANNYRVSQQLAPGR